MSYLLVRDMESTRIFPRSKEYIINTLYDIIELQNGSLILSDVVRGIVYYRVSMYGYGWELMYTVAERQMQSRRGESAGIPAQSMRGEPAGSSAGKALCSVTLRIIGERRENEKEMHRAFALLEAMLNM